MKELEHYIPHDHIIKELGGSENWEYKYVEPTADENVRLKDHSTRDKLIESREGTVLEFQQLTHDWIAAGLAGEGTAEIKSKRDALAKSLKQGYWELDPYVRAKSYYDRTAMIQPGGKIDFYPPPETVLKAQEPHSSASHNTSADDVD